MITIGFCNLKGGVGKTTACQNIAVALAKMGHRVAVIDMDPQSNLSAGFGVTPSETDPQVFDLLSGGATWDDIVCTKEGVDIIPSSLNLVMAELNHTGPVSQDTVLRDALKRIDGDRYDYILLDSPPQLGIFTRNVLAACSKIIVPMDGGFYSLFGLRLLNGAMPVFRERLNPELEIKGILMTNYNPRLYIARQVYDEVCRTFGSVVFKNCVRQNISLVEASSMGMSIFEYSPKSKGAECYRDVARELLDKLRMTHEEAGKPAAVPEPENVPEAEESLSVIEESVGVIETPEPESVPEVMESVPEPESVPEIPEPSEPLDIPEEKPEPVYTVRTLGDYEEGIKQSVLDMLPEKRKPMWNQILGAVSGISRDEIDARVLREDFEECDKERYKFYVLNDERDTFWQVMYPDQIIDPMRCVMKFDEYDGSAEVYI
ncbi:MAG: AAA family ATPase [Synergistaceae bacterium]|nr:AAA family ATPase [Synergistaceae bacterium]